MATFKEILEYAQTYAIDNRKEITKKYAAIIYMHGIADQNDDRAQLLQRLRARPDFEEIFRDTIIVSLETLLTKGAGSSPPSMGPRIGKT